MLGLLANAGGAGGVCLLSFLVGDVIILSCARLGESNFKVKGW